MDLSRRSFLRVAGASLLTLVAAPTVAAKSMAEKAGGVVLASKADAISEMEKFDQVKKMEKYLRDPEAFALMPQSKIEKFILTQLRARARRDVPGMGIEFDITVNKNGIYGEHFIKPFDIIPGGGANKNAWSNVAGSTYIPKTNWKNTDFYFSVGPLFEEDGEFRMAVMDDVWRQVFNWKYRDKSFQGYRDEMKAITEMNGKEIWEYAQRHGEHRFDGKRESDVKIEKAEALKNSRQYIKDRIV